jgi:putative MATE family efflux protein
MVTLAVPTMLSMLVTILYNMADTFFVGQTGDPNQVAAVSITTPIFLLLMAVGNIFGIGGSSYIARSLGEGNKDKVKRVSSFCCYGCIISGVIMMALFLVGMPYILDFVGTSPKTYTFSKEYLTCIGYGAVFVVFSNAFGNIVRGEGAAKPAMIGMMLGTVINIVLDPIMILVMDMGVVGAAVATILGNVGACVYYVVYLCGKKTILSIAPKYFMCKNGIMSGVVSVGLPASLNNVLMSVSNIIMNIYLKGYGDKAVAAMGIAQKINMLVILLNIGLAMGVQPLIAYYYGAHQFQKMRRTMKLAMISNVIMGTTISLAYFLFTEPIVKSFINNAQVIDYGVMMLRALMISGPVIGIMFVFSFTFQGMGKAVQSLVLSIGRQGLFFLPILVVANKIIGLEGIVFAQPVADFASIFIALFMFLGIRKELHAIEKAAA